MTGDRTAQTLAHGSQYPYDARDDDTMPEPGDWAYAAARGVLADLSDRAGIKWSLEKVEQDTRGEIVQALADIIRLASVSPA